MIGPTFELRSGAPVQYLSADTGEWREGTLVHASANGEEWLVKNRFGRFWLALSQLRPIRSIGDQDAGH